MDRFVGRSEGLAIAVAAVIVAILAPTGDANETARTAQLAPKPVLRKAKLVDVPRRRARRVFVSVPVRYPEAGDARGGYRVKGMTGWVIVRDRSGRRRKLRARPASGVYVPARGRRTAHAHLRLSVRGGRVVRRAVGGRHSAAVTVRATLGLDRNGDGAIESNSLLSMTTAVPTLTPAGQAAEQEQPPGLLGGSGSDPCNTVATNPGPATCVDQPGSVWKASGFMHSNTQQIHCPTGYGAVNEIPLFFGGNPAHTIETSSKHYTDGATMLAGAVGANVSITDYNIRGHPVAYTPVIACCKPDDPNDGTACTGD